jgi:predicted AlkP superfamily pyrophosphatase or phosphodiesterase
MRAARNFARGAALLLLVVLGWWPAPLLQAQAPPAKHVILLSLDGARPDAVRTVLAAALAARGSISWTAQTTTPSVTLPTHASMLSGVGPAIHGVDFNDWTSTQPYFRRPTIFTEVTRNGGRAAALVAKARLLMFMPPGSVITAQHLVYPRYRQIDVVETASRFFLEQQPAVLFVHVADPDDIGHRHGWMSPAYLQVIAGVPALIETLLRAFDEAGVAGSALLIVTADHGGHERTHGTNRPEDMTIPWMAFGGAARAGGVISRPIVIYDTAATVLSALAVPIPGDWQGRPVRDALR